LPTIQLADPLGANVDVEPAPDSAFGTYFTSFPQFFLDHSSLKELAGVTLADPPITSINLGLKGSPTIPADSGNVKFGLKAGTTGSIGFFIPSDINNSLFLDGEAGENIPVALNERYVSLALGAEVDPSARFTASDLKFGFKAQSAIGITNYQKFSPEASLLDAVKNSFERFRLAASVADLQSMEKDSIISLAGSGSLRFSATANLLAAANPLATVDLPLSLPAIEVSDGASVSVGASFGLSGSYEIRVHKIGPGTVRLGYYKDRAAQLTISAEASAGVALSLGDGDLFSNLISAISPSAKADIAELKAAQFDPVTISAITQTVKSGVERCLEVALSAELSETVEKKAAFLYEIDLGGIDERGRSAVERALSGNLSDLVGHETELPAGIKAISNIFTNLHQAKHTLKINLLGIYNCISVSKLALQQSIMFDEVTGEITLTDKASAKRIQAGMLNVGGKPNKSDPQQLRTVLASSFLITATYRAAQCVTTPPKLTSTHTFCELHENTPLALMQDELNAAIGLGLLTIGARDQLLAGKQSFGRSMVYARVDYDDPLVTALFLDRNGPRALEEYERIGRDAMQVTIRDNTTSAARLQPLTNPDLWKKMKESAPQLPDEMRRLSIPDQGAIRSDFLTIIWWAAAMRGAAERLAKVRNFIQSNPGFDPATNPNFKKLRDDLAKHLKDVTAKTPEHFGRPWGLVAMDMLAGNSSSASVIYTGPVINFVKRRARVAAATDSGGA
jgi:hypothetical protein